MPKAKMTRERWKQVPAAATPCASGLLSSSWAPFGLAEGLRDLRGVSELPLEAASPCVLEGKLQSADFSEAGLKHLRLREVLIEECQCNKSTFEDCSFSGRVYRTVFEDTKFVLSSLGGAWTEVSFVRCQFRRTAFADTAVLTNCIFDSCKFGDFEFNAVELRDVEFRGEVKGVTLSGLPRVPMARHAGMAPRFIRASFQDAILQGCYFLRGVDFQNVVLPKRQSWVLVRQARDVVHSLAAQLRSVDPENRQHYDLFEHMLPRDEIQVDVVYMLVDLIADYGDRAGARIWKALCGRGEVNDAE